MKRVLILGCGGAGKSTLARKMAISLGLPIFHLDQVIWAPGWIEIEPAAMRKKLGKITSGRRWILDGALGRHRMECIRKADTVVFMDIGRMTCLMRVAWRQIRNWGRVRQDMAPGCVEKIDLEFWRWIWRYPEHSRPAILRDLSGLPKNRRVHILRNTNEAKRFLASISA
jgi:adenylate kinase family enzyme